MELVNIRQATKKDALAISEVLILSQWFTYESLYSTEYIQKLINQYYNVQRIEQEIVSISNEWHGYFIAEIDGKVLGVIGGGVTADRIGEVYVFYLDPEMRGKGIGTRLLNFFTKIQKHIYGVTEQRVAVAKGNSYGIPFYEARGFIYQHEETAYGGSHEDISLIYRRELV